MHRQKSLTDRKMVNIESIYNEFNVTASGEGFTEEDSKLKFSTIVRLVQKKLDAFETKRLVDKLDFHPDTNLTYYEAMEIFKQLLEEDLDEVINRGFDKIDVSKSGELSVKIIRKALLTNNKTSIKSEIKKVNKHLIKEFADVFERNDKISKEQFSLLIKDILLNRDRKDTNQALIAKYKKKRISKIDSASVSSFNEPSVSNLHSGLISTRSKTHEEKLKRVHRKSRSISRLY